MSGKVSSWSTWQSEGTASAKLITVDKGAGTVCASLQVGDTDQVCVVGEMGTGSGRLTALGRQRDKFRIYIL